MYKIYIFGIADCPDCNEQKEIIDEFFGEGNYSFINIESEDIDDMKMMAKYEVDEAPTTIILKKNGDKLRVFKHSGVIAANKLQKFLTKIG